MIIPLDDLEGALPYFIAPFGSSPPPRGGFGGEFEDVGVGDFEAEALDDYFV